MSQWTIPWNQLLHKAMICGPVLPLVRLCFIITIRSWQKCKIVKSLLAICIKSSKVRLTHVILMASWSKGPILHGTFFALCKVMSKPHALSFFLPYTHNKRISKEWAFFSLFQERNITWKVPLNKAIFIHTHTTSLFQTECTDWLLYLNRTGHFLERTAKLMIKLLRTWWN